jgi:hypothetical protein
VKVDDAACKATCRVAASEPRTNRVHVNMLPSVWLSIKSFLLEETKKNKLEMYHDNDVVVTTANRGVFVTPDKRIQLATVERQTEPHHKVERMIAYTREHILVLQSVFGFFFGIGPLFRYPKSKSEQERVARKKAKTITTSLTAGLSDGEGLARPRTPLTTIPVPSPVTKIVTAPVTLDVRINTLTQIPEEEKVNDKDVVAKYVNRGLEGVTLLYDWASHGLTLRVGYKTPILSETDDNLFAVFKTIVDELFPEGDGVKENYPETGKHIFFKNEMHDVLHYDVGDTVKISPSLGHDAPLFIPQTMCRHLISEFKENLCGSQSGNSTSSVSAMSFSSGSDK